MTHCCRARHIGRASEREEGVLAERQKGICIPCMAETGIVSYVTVSILRTNFNYLMNCGVQLPSRKKHPSDYIPRMTT